MTLRDSHGIPQVRFVTGNKILRILKSNGASYYSYCCPSAHTLLLSLLSLIISILYFCFGKYLLFGDRIGTVHPRGPLAPRQKGGCSPQAPRSEPQGQGLQIQIDFDREQDPQVGEVL